MKTFLTSAAFAIGLAGAAVADPVFGIWKTEPSDGVYYHIKMQACGDKICGAYIAKFQNGEKIANDGAGKNAVYDMIADGSGNYAGKAFRVSDGKVFTGKGSLNGNTLRMKGCVAGGLICQGQDWTRVK